MHFLVKEIKLACSSCRKLNWGLKDLESCWPRWKPERIAVKVETYSFLALVLKLAENRSFCGLFTCRFTDHPPSPPRIPAAAAAKSLQSCPTLCDPIDGSPPGSPVPGILQARTLEWVAISFSDSWKWKVKVKSLSRVRLLATPWTAAYQAPPSMGFSRQEYWSGVPLPSPPSQLVRLRSWVRPRKTSADLAVRIPSDLLCTSCWVRFVDNSAVCLIAVLTRTP